ncbi:MAG: hypothetical protein AAF399_03665 [Bacteroidota bacterium]
MRSSLIILLLASCWGAWAQEVPPPISSTHGAVHTPRGDLHILMIFVRFEGVSKMQSVKLWPDVSEEGVLPRMAQGASNQLLHADQEGFRAENRLKNLSDFYYAMSGTRFRITGDVFPIQVPISYIPEKGGNFFRRQQQMNQAAVNWIAKNYPDFDWSKYDNRTNAPNYRASNVYSEPDQILDYVVFMYRDQGSTGMGASGNLSIPNSPYRILHGHTGIKSYPGPKHNWEYFKHEFAHNLYDCPHYLGANSADGTKFYTQKGWGLMSAWHAPFFTTNAWEAWWLGWLTPQVVREDQQVLLRDFVTGEDAIQIPIPGTDDVLWLENHQKLDHWDDKIFYNNRSQGNPTSAKGLYAYIVGTPGKDRSKPRLNPFRAGDANFIKMLNGEGNFDFQVRDSMRTKYGARFPVFEKVQNNPISGQNDFQFIRYDFNQDGRIGINMKHGNRDGRGGKREEMDVWFERVGEEVVHSLNCTGDEADAFQVGDEIGLNGVVPALNFPDFQRKKQTLAPYLINGIRIEVIERHADGSLLLDIQMDDWELRKQHRWCGNLLLSSEVLPASGALAVSSGSTLVLDLSMTPNREDAHPVTGTFVNPTTLTLEAGHHLRLEKRSEMIVTDHSILILEAGATLELERGSRLTFRRNGKLLLKAGSQIILENRSVIQIGEDSEFEMEEGILADVGTRAKLRGDLRSQLRSKRKRPSETAGP